MTDAKSYDLRKADGTELKAGDPLHKMLLRLTIDENMFIHDVAAVTCAGPYRICSEAASAMSALKGMQIAKGWMREVTRQIGGPAGCTHLIELLGPMATTAYQTLTIVRQRQPDVPGPAGRPAKIDSCYAYASHRELVRQRWPNFYSGSDT